MTLARPRSETVAATASAGVILVLIVAVADGGFLRSIELGAFLLANTVVFSDMFDTALRLWLRRRNTIASTTFPCPTSIPLDVGRFSTWQARMHLKPWAIVVSVYNAEAEIDDFIENIQPFREKLWVIDDGSTDRTVLRMRQAGIRVVEGGVNRKKPGAIREILSHIPAEVETIVVLDPDVRFVEIDGRGSFAEIERVLFEFQRSGAAALCPHIVVREDGWLARLQEFEYSMSLSLGRKSLGDRAVTSGVAVYRRDAIKRVLDEHGLSVYAEDLRNALILLAAGERIYYDGRLVLQTEGKRTLASWFSQRVGWYYGLLKVYVEQFDGVRRFTSERLTDKYQFLIYVGAFTILLHPLKLAALVLLTMSAASGATRLLGIDVPLWLFVDPSYLLFSWVQYSVFVFVLLFLAVRQERRKGLLLSIPVYYFYALFHLLPVTIGFANWISLRLFGRRVWADHYQDEAAVREEWRRNGG